MNLSQLYYFRKLAELQHYTKAAKELYISQPALSDSIASLEQELGVALFRREGRNVKLTAYGREFYDCVISSLNELERGISLIKQQSMEISGTINVGCIPTLLGDFLPTVISNFTARNPLTKVNIFHGMSLEVARGVSEGKYDIGFGSMVEDEPNLVYVPVITQELVVIVNNAHPLADRRELALSDLKEYALTTYRDTIPIGKVVRQLLEERGVEATFSYDDEISTGGIISITPTLAAIVARTPFLKQFSNLSVLKLTDVPPDTRLIYMIYSRKNFINAAVEAFADHVVTQEMRLPKG